MTPAYDLGQPVLELPVLQGQPVQLFREVLQEPLLTQAGPPGGVPVGDHAPALSLVDGASAPVQPLGTGVCASYRVKKRQEFLQLAEGGAGLEHRRGLEVDHLLLAEHCGRTGAGLWSQLRWFPLLTKLGERSRTGEKGGYAEAEMATYIGRGGERRGTFGAHRDL